MWPDSGRAEQRPFHFLFVSWSGNRAPDAMIFSFQLAGATRPFSNGEYGAPKTGVRNGTTRAPHHYEEMITRAKPVALIVEDEPLILMLAVEAFIDAGFAVLEADCADEALSIYSSETPIDLLFTDVNMPGALDGIDLAEKLIQLKPSLPIIITSALPIIRSIDHLSASFFSKPYSSLFVGAFARELLKA